MALYFLDSSAIVKRYFQEQEHKWIETIHDTAQEHGLYIAQAALCRRGYFPHTHWRERMKAIVCTKYGPPEVLQLQ